MNKYSREIQIISLLTDNHQYSVQQIAELLGTTKRNVYYEFEHLKQSGFKLIKEGTKYRLDRNNPFFKRLHGNISLSKEDALFVYKHLNFLANNPQAQDIKAKLENFYNLEILTSPSEKKKAEQNFNLLKEAIRNKKIVILKDYSSPHSNTISDRLVEPFELMNNETEVRCYELKSHQNKTFKIARMQSIEIQEVEWLHEKEHKNVFTDIFHFSGEEKQLICLELGQLAYSLLVEEYPLSEAYITRNLNGTWRFEIEVVSFLGIGRFILGLHQDIKILENDALKTYIGGKIDQLVSCKKHLNAD